MKTVILLCTWFTLSLPLGALAQELPAKLKSALLLKLLSFDRKLIERSPDGIRIGLLGKGAAKNKTKAFRALNGKQSQGKTIQVIPLMDFTHSDLANKLKSARVNALYVMPGLSQDEVVTITSFAQANGIATFGGSRNLVEQGLAVGFDTLNGKPKIFVNPKTAKEHGMELPSRVLRLAKLIQ